MAQMLPIRPARSEGELAQLEAAYCILDLYVWLSFRLEEGFPGRATAQQQRTAVSSLIDEALSRLSPDPDSMSKRCATLCLPCLRMYEVGNV